MTPSMHVAAKKELVARTALHFELPETLLLAWACAETGWDPLVTERYEPNLDWERVSGQRSTWAQHPEWLTEGPTCEEFFVFHPEREADWRAGRDYTFVAQTDLASAYGPFLIPYPSALRWGYTGVPADLKDPEFGIWWAGRVLGAEIDAAEALGLRGIPAVAHGLQAVGVVNKQRPTQVDVLHLQYYGYNFFG